MHCLKKLMLAALFAAATLCVVDQAQASAYYGHQGYYGHRAPRYQNTYRPHGHGQRVGYVPVKKRYDTWVIKYDHCGRPYRARITTYRTSWVPVAQRAHY